MAEALRFTPPKRKRQSWLKAIMIALGIVLLFSLIALLAFSRVNQGTEIKIEPELMLLLAPAQVPPDLALLILADYPPEQVWQEALERSQWEAALASFLFAPVYSDSQSIEHLLELADALRQDNPDAAASYLLAAADLTRISPELNDRRRAELIVTIGEKLYSLGLAVAAVTEWRQASILAHYAPSMPPMYRAILLQDLALLYKQAGAERLEASARQTAAQVNTLSSEVPVLERIILDTEALPSEPAALQAARDKRRLTAQQAVKGLGSHLEDFAYTQLRDALSAEALLQRQWVTEELRQPHPREVQAALLLAHINWLQRERMLAWGIGGEEFSAWIERRAQIELDLHEAWDALELVRLDQSIRQGSQEHATLAQRDWWATRLIQARLTRDPRLESEEVISSMLPNNADGAGDEILRLDWIEGRFWRIPREYVGTNQLPD